MSLILRRILFFLAVALLLCFGVDSASVWLRARHATPTNPYETLSAPRIYAIPEKGNKTEYQIDADNPVQQVTCVHSLFPHGNYSPCWKVSRSLHNPIPM
jgi:hypothetical protein